MKSDKLHDECGIVGMYAPERQDIARSVYFGLHSLQHRGQESAGIAVNKYGNITCHKDMGLVQEVFDNATIQRLQGDMAIGHVRYSTAGESMAANAMPLVVYCKDGALALAHNGNLVNAPMLRAEMQEKGIIFQTSIDSEVIAALIAQNMGSGNVEDAIVKSLERVKGAYALVVTWGKKLMGVRDPNGIRPLCIGTCPDGSYVLSSESCVFPLMGAEFLRDVEAGELVSIEDGKLSSIQYKACGKTAHCSFEYVYFARPDSRIDRIGVYTARNRCGKILAAEHPAAADMVIAVPDSGTVAAIGYAEESGIPYGEGLIKNRYVGRTFIQPEQRMRELSVRLKLNVLKGNVAGKRIVMVDDSIVRGTTIGKIVRMLKTAGAKEIHVRVASPPVIAPCFFGIDTPDENQLAAAKHDLREICRMAGADSLGYLSVKGLFSAIGAPENTLCAACFTGDYPMEPMKAPKPLVRNGID